MGDQGAAGDVMPERKRLTPGEPVRYIGTVDVQTSATLDAVELLRLDTGATAAAVEPHRRLDAPGRYRVMGEIAPGLLESGRYELRLRLR